jgi:hypothetical protein
MDQQSLSRNTRQAFEVLTDEVPHCEEAVAGHLKAMQGEVGPAKAKRKEGIREGPKRPSKRRDLGRNDTNNRYLADIIAPWGYPSSAKLDNLTEEGLLMSAHKVTYRAIICIRNPCLSRRRNHFCKAEANFQRLPKDGRPYDFAAWRKRKFTLKV